MQVCSQPSPGGRIGLIAGGIAVLLGLAILAVRPAPGGVGAGDVLILVVMIPVALIGSRLARSMSTAAPAIALDPADGRWLTVVVAGQGPTPGTGRKARLPLLPRSDPERRRLSRRADRRHPVSAGHAR